MVQSAPTHDDPSCPIKGMYRLFALITEHSTEQGNRDPGKILS
jgi:hypothetical protein